MEDPKITSQGVIVYGLHLQGASWDSATATLAEATPKVHFEPLPPLLLQPMIKEDVAASEAAEAEAERHHFYECPVYRCENRAGKILSNGHSTNFVCSIRLASREKPDHWTRRGVAVILQLTET